MKPLSVEKQQVLYLIKSDKDYERYFFDNVGSLEWFEPLENEKYFNPENIVFDKDGNAIFWHILDYLERVSVQTTEHPEYGKKLLIIIEDLVRYSYDHKKINNYYIWWYCVKILNNIPNMIIIDTMTTKKSDGGKINFNIWLEEWAGRYNVQRHTIDDIGTKLLPKFLRDENMVVFAEAIIDAITNIKAGKRLQTPLGKEDAQLIWDSYWLLDAFEKNRKQIAEKCSDNVIFNLADKLRAALEYEQNDAWDDMEKGPNRYQLRISRVPISNLKTDEIGYQQSIFECSVRQYSPEEQKKVQNKDDFWASRNIKPEKVIGQDFIFKAENDKEFVFKIREQLPTGIDWAEKEELDQKIKLLFNNLYSDYSYIWLKSLDQDIVNPRSDAPEVLTNIIKNVLLARCDLRKDHARKILESFLFDKYQFPIFKRFVLFCVNNKWNMHADLFEMFINSYSDAISNPAWEVEVQDILRVHCKEIDAKIKGRIKELIKDVPEYYRKEGPKHMAYWRYKWLSPLRDDPDYSSDYLEAKKQAEIKEDKPYVPQRSAIKMAWIGDKSILSKEEIVGIPIEELIKTLDDFKGPYEYLGFDGKPDKRGLAEMLRAAAKESSKKFTDNLGLFNKQGLYIYLNAIFQGFWDAIKEGKVLPWGDILQISFDYINQSWFLDEALKAQGEDRGEANEEYVWLISSVVDLIKEGCWDNERAIGQKYIILVETVFNKIFEIIKGKNKPEPGHDAISYSINTTLGRAIESYIVFSLHVARVTKQKEAGWGLNKYERFFSKGIESYIWFGRCLPNLSYLDLQYVKDKVKKLKELSVNEIEWQMFIEGYLYVSNIYDDIYSLMRPHYFRAIENKIFEDQVDNRLVQHIAIGYLRGFESLEIVNSDGQPSLFWKMINEADVPEKRERWLEVANFFWSVSGKTTKKDDQDDKEKISEEMRKKILNFWSWTVSNKDSIKTKLGEDYTAFLGSMSDLTIFLDRIDEKTEEWLMLSAPHIEVRHHMTFFIDYLTRYEDDESVKRIGRIFLKVLEGTTPDFKREDIQLIVKRLYELAKNTNDHDIKIYADNICNTYGRRGIHFLKEIFFQNQP